MVLRTRQLLKVLGASAALGLGCDSAEPTKMTVDKPVVEQPVETPVVEEPAETPAVDEPEAVSGAVARIDANLASLRALELFEVGELLVESPFAGGSCYGVPCPDEVAGVTARLATGLEELVALSADLGATGSAACAAGGLRGEADAHLATLDSLHIVELGAFIEVAPANNPMCYNLPCEEDIAAAAAASCDRAARLGELAARAAEAFGVERVLTPAEAVERIDENLSALRSLDVFEVGELFVGNRISSSSCYLCPIDFEQDEPEAAVRLEALTAIADVTIGDYRDGDLAAFASCDPAAAEASLQALRALEIIGVGALVERHPAGEGLCYASSCTEADFATAKAMVCQRAAAIEDLVLAASRL